MLYKEEVTDNIQELKELNVLPDFIIVHGIIGDGGNSGDGSSDGFQDVMHMMM